MNNTVKIKILPEDKIELSQDQKNLIELAFDKQIPPEDAEFIEKVQKNYKSNDTNSKTDPFSELSRHFTDKYGIDFGMVYLAAIMGGKEKYKETVKSIETLRATERIKKSEKN